MENISYPMVILSRYRNLFERERIVYTPQYCSAWNSSTQSPLLRKGRNVEGSGVSFCKLRPLLGNGTMFVLESTGCGFEVWYFEIDSSHTLHHHQGSRGSIHTSASLISSLSSILSTVKHPWLMLSYMAGSSLISRASVIWVDRRMKPNIMASTTKGCQ